MSARLIDGKALADSVLRAVAQAATALGSLGVRPGLAVVIAGDDPASKIYVRNKVRACERAGVHSTVHEFGADTTTGLLVERIAALNADAAVHGILVQLPLPRGVDSTRVLSAISASKDVDGFHLENVGALVAGRPGFVPCTPAAVIRMIDHAGVGISGGHAVVLGRSDIVGKPVAHLLLKRDATVTICHSKTPDLGAIARQADILVAAVGRAGLVKAEMVKPGACVIDVGINRGADGKLAGDVDFEAVKMIAGWITPVPGGVGPMTIAMLIESTVRAAARSVEGC